MDINLQLFKTTTDKNSHTNVLEQIRQMQKSEAWKMNICFCAEMSWKHKFGTYHKRDEALEFTEKINGDRSMAVT